VEVLEVLQNVLVVQTHLTLLVSKNRLLESHWSWAGLLGWQSEPWANYWRVCHNSTWPMRCTRLLPLIYTKLLYWEVSLALELIAAVVFSLNAWFLLTHVKFLRSW